MKKAHAIFFGTLSATIIFACSKHLLDKPPLGQLDAAAVSNKSGVESLLIGAYSILDGVSAKTLGNPWESSGSNWLYGSVCGTEAHKGSNSTDQGPAAQIETFNSIASNEYFESKWAALYDGVQRCNDVLRIMRNTHDMTAADTVETRSEALFLRAYYHFEAKKIWNNVPFVDESITYDAGNYKLSNTADIWPRIEDDLKYAAANLPDSQYQIGRANHYTAIALLAKVYLFQHKYPLCKTLIDEIVSSGRYALGKYSDNFNAATQNNQEYIFAVQTSVQDGSTGYNGNIGDILNYPVGGPASCCGFFQPSQYLVNHFKTDPGTGLPDLANFNATDVTNDIGLETSDPFVPYGGTLDPRLDWTVGRRGIPYLDWGNHPGKAWILEQSTAGPYSPLKNIYYKIQQGTLTDVSFWTAGATANNINLIRYADVLLWGAEVEIEIGSLQKATDYVNEVRRRMEDPSEWVCTYINPNQPELGFTTTPAANYKIGEYPSFASQDYARKAVRFERMLELGMEGHRFFDLVRWGIAAEEINTYLPYETKVSGYLKDAIFTPNRNEYFPIPQGEIDKTDRKLIQNPGY